MRGGQVVAVQGVRSVLCVGLVPVCGRQCRLLAGCAVDRLGEEQETAESGAACSGSREWAAAAAAAAGEVIHGDGSR